MDYDSAAGSTHMSENSGRGDESRDVSESKSREEKVGSSPPDLDEFSDPIEYDLEDSSDTGVAFYRALAHETGGPVLELACGTGRVAIPIAKEGIPVTGL